MLWYEKDIKSEEKIKRLNIINSITGVKPANLIGTRSKSGVPNLAIFSSVVHLGSNPALIGFITRPYKDVKRHTYSNIKETGIYTINMVLVEEAQKAHFTSAKFEEDISEFETCQFKEIYNDGFEAPFVQSSPVRMGLEFIREIPIPENGTSMMVGKVVNLYINDNILSEEGYIDLEKAKVAGISGLNSYYSLKQEFTFPYARKEETPDFKNE